MVKTRVQMPKRKIFSCIWKSESYVFHLFQRQEKRSLASLTDSKWVHIPKKVRLAWNPTKQKSGIEKVVCGFKYEMEIHLTFYPQGAHSPDPKVSWVPYSIWPPESHINRNCFIYLGNIHTIHLKFSYTILSSHGLAPKNPAVLRTLKND